MGVAGLRASFGMDASRLGVPPESLEGNSDSTVNNQGKSDCLWGKVLGCNNDGADPEKLARIRGTANLRWKMTAGDVSYPAQI